MCELILAASLNDWESCMLHHLLCSWAEVSPPFCEVFPRLFVQVAPFLGNTHHLHQHARNALCSVQSDALQHFLITSLQLGHSLGPLSP
mmetsp:Transcript_55026/g.120356  ORF Transcript_55026/g.120356 Transcript_55026/m.120356 type:complete len:89 (+) Transcript_55026:2635-2901(+)